MGHIKDSNLDQDIAIEQMQQAAMNIINELNKRQMPPHIVMPHLLTDVEKAKQVVIDDDVKISQLSKEAGISEEILSDYRENPATLKKASNSTIERLITKYYEKYFNRNEIEKFRFMLIKTVMAYLKENKKDEIDYDPVYKLYKLCQQADWHRLARIEEFGELFILWIINIKGSKKCVLMYCSMHQMRDQVRFKIGVMSIIMKCLFIIQQILVFYQL